jgi:hypothetical protein
MNQASKRILLSVVYSAILTAGSLTLQSCDKAASLIDANNGAGNNNGSASPTVTPPTVTAPETIYISSSDYSVSGLGSSWVQSFTINTSTSFVFRFASKTSAQAAIMRSDQVNNFKNNASFSGYGLFDKQIGTVYLTLAPGTYYVGARNSVAADNSWSIELDYTISLPASDRCTYADIYVQGSKIFPNGGKMWQPFTVQSGVRYFLDGSSVGFKTQIISADQLSAFSSGQSYFSYSDYDQTDGGAPGLYEIKLPPGDYVLACTGIGPSAITYTMERWRVN